MSQTIYNGKNDTIVVALTVMSVISLITVMTVPGVVSRVNDIGAFCLGGGAVAVYMTGGDGMAWAFTILGGITTVYAFYTIAVAATPVGPVAVGMAL